METTDKIAEILSGVKYYAHRGCYNRKRPENSVEAIKVAADNGLGLEIDVHLTKDGRLVVFHDHTLRRMCKRKGVIEDMTLDEITACALNGTVHKIPALEEVLSAVSLKIPAPRSASVTFITLFVWVWRLKTRCDISIPTASQSLL